MRQLIAQFTRFGIVGAIGFVIDFVVFNALIATVLSADEVHEGPLIAKVISTTLAIVFNWLGNRHWTFRAHRGRQLLREGVEFGIVSVGGMLIGLACLWVSHYALGFTSVLADNIAGNVIGLGLGTVFRFAFYRSWVFHPSRSMPLRPAEGGVIPGATDGGGQAIASAEIPADAPKAPRATR